MQCFHPSKIRSGGRLLERPCNRCMACRINKTYEWSTRLVYEMESHDKACFITLTYDPDFYQTMERLLSRIFRSLTKGFGRSIMAIRLVNINFIFVVSMVLLLLDLIIMALYLVLILSLRSGFASKSMQKVHIILPLLFLSSGLSVLMKLVLLLRLA